MAVNAVRVDGQLNSLCLCSRRAVGSLRFHIVIGQRVVGCTDAELHGHIQAGWGFTATRYAHQNQVGLVIFVSAGAVVVVEGKFTASIRSI